MSRSDALVASTARRGESVLVWNVETGEQVASLDVPGNADVCFSPDGRWLAVSGQSNCRLVRANDWSTSTVWPRSINGEFGVVAFHADGRILATPVTPNTVRLIDVDTGRELVTLTADEGTSIISLCFTSDNSRLIAAADFGPLLIWDFGRIRRELARIGLDWSSEPIPPAIDPQPFSVTYDPGKDAR